MRGILLLLTFFLSMSLSYGQDFREYEVHDETEVYWNGDTTIKVTRHKVYYSVNGNDILIKDFTTNDGNLFVRDFDIMRSGRWYTVVGGRYFGLTSKVWISDDKGKTWDEDTSFYPATRLAVKNGGINRHDAIHNIQEIGKDTFMLFVDYYTTSIFYSTNAGKNWEFWLSSTPANYRGLFWCKDSFYIWGLEGDGFPGFMFKESRSKLFQTNYSAPSCATNKQLPKCTYVTSSQKRYEQYLDFRQYMIDNCAEFSSIENGLIEETISVYPNPSQNQVRLSVKNGQANAVLWFNSKGQQVSVPKVERTDNRLYDVSQLSQGIYLIRLQSNQGWLSGKVIIN